MNHSTKRHRRDWFRLAADAALQPIEQPLNHDGMDLSELPPMREASLSPKQVTALLNDIAGLTTDIQLMQRIRSEDRASVHDGKSSERLRAAGSALMEGGVARIQVRYRWKNVQWIDTLARQPDGHVRLVRIAHPGSG